MKIVIDVPEEYYNAIKEIPDWQCPTDTLIIKFGTPLPKGHGRLIDADELLKMTDGYKSELGRLKADPFVKCGIKTVENFIQDAPTIIEADKAESEGEE